MTSIRLFVALLLLAGAAAFAATVEPATPIERAPPPYPDSAGEASGHVRIQFTIDRDGHVRDAAVQDSVPQGVFDAAALGAVAGWRYQPRRIDGQAVEQAGNLIDLNFLPPPPAPGRETAVLEKVQAYYSPDMFAAKLEGDVTVMFDVTPLGMATNAHVVHSTLPGVFDNEAVGAVMDSLFKPPVVNGVPVGATGLQVTVPYRLANAKIKPKRLTEINIHYPEAAAAAGISGFCRIAVTVAEDGTVAKADIVDMLPGTLFESACRSLTTSLRFEPPSADKTGHVTRQVDYFLRFEMPGAKNLLKHGQFAKIRYTIGTHGEIKNAEIVAVSGPDVPVSQILKTFRQRRQDPAMVNGVAVEKPDQFVTITGD
jgi:TonB family protein